MPSASNNNQSSTKLVKQTSVNSVNSGGPSGASGGKGGNKKITENTTKSNNTNATTTNNNETSSASSVKATKENTNNVVAAGGVSAASANSKIWETASAAGNNANNTANKDAGNDALNPMKLTFTTIEHKIRNLEKRKTKLEGYRAIQASGKELSSDQRAAVAKYDAVIATLDFARDLVKQMQQFTKDAEKEQKKQARKDLIAKAQAETVKIREVLILQNILSCLTDDAVRSDFLSGENGAAKLETNEMEILEKFCLDVQTRRPETSEDVPFATSAQKAAEVFSMTIDARPKQYGETTYENVKRIFHRIQESDYLDKIYLTDVPEPEVKTTEDGTEPSSALNNDDAAATTELNNQEQEDSALDESMEKQSIDGAIVQDTVSEANTLDNGVLLGQPPQPMQQQAIIKEHLEMQQQQQQQQQVALTNLPAQQAQTPLISAPMAPPATAVPSFQPAAPQTGHSGATTPVHVAMYHPSMQQPTPQQIPQMPPAGAIIGGVPTNAAGQMITGIAPQQQVGVQNASAQSVHAAQQQQQQQHQQQRQMLTSPATGQAGVAGGPLALHNANGPAQPPQPGHYNTAIRQHQQYLQQMRPLAEVIGGGNFYFLQDSELDSPDLNNQAIQGVPQNTIVFEQQQQQPPQQNKNTHNLIQEQNMPTPPTQQQQQQPHQLQQVNQQLSLGQPQQQQSTTQTPIQTQTFTNQSFPQMPPPSQQQPQQNQPSTNSAGLVNSNTPSPLFQQQQQHQQQQQKVNNTNSQQLFSPVQNQNIHAPQQQQQQQHQQQTHLMMAAAVSNETSQQQQPTPALMMINRLATAGQPTNPLMQQQQQQQQMLLQQQITPQNQNLVGVMQQQLPPSSSNNPAGDMNQTPKNSGFPFENPVMAGLNYEQQMQTKLNAEKVLNALQEVSAAATHLHNNELINEWDETGFKGSTSTNSNQQDFKSSTSNVEPTSNKWSAEVNANSPITVQQSQSRKNEWTSSSSSNNGNTADTTGGYGNDNRPESNHWHSQDSTGYGRGSAGRSQGGGANTGGGYQRQRNDDRREDRRTGGGGGGNGGGGSGGGYRGRSNYGSGNPQQNGQSRGGNSSGGMYFRNNDNTNNNAYYQNGSGGSSGNVYSNKDNRYDSRGGGGGNYRGPRGSDNNSANARNNGPPPRHMGNRSSGGNSNANNTNSNAYLNSRQSSNRMPLGIENKN